VCTFTGWGSAPPPLRPPLLQRWLLGACLCDVRFASPEVPHIPMLYRCVCVCVWVVGWVGAWVCVGGWVIVGGWVCVHGGACVATKEHAFARNFATFGPRHSKTSGMVGSVAGARRAGSDIFTPSIRTAAPLPGLGRRRVYSVLRRTS
jgi:hypothetical protein